MLFLNVWGLSFLGIFVYVISITGPDFDILAKDESIAGWFIAQDTVHRLLHELTSNSILGPYAEIGLYHGKSFCFLLERIPYPHKLFGFDVFEDQQFNYDRAGVGDSSRVGKHIRRIFGSDKNKMEQFVLHKADSLYLHSNEVMNLTGNQSIVFFSIDGCHTYFCTLSDLMLAGSVLHDKGIIMLDDYYNPDWPGVSVGANAFLLQNKDTFTAVAYGQNKLYITKRNNYHSTYQMVEKYCKGRKKIGYKGCFYRFNTTVNHDIMIQIMDSLQP